MSETPFDLNQTIVASPCSASWAGMRGDDKVRHCPDCRRNVYNLSAMARAEAEALVRDTEGRVCVRFYRRTDGTMLTRDCPVGVQSWRWRMITGFVAGGVMLITIAFAGLGWLASRSEPGASPLERVLHTIFPSLAPQVVMGTPCPPVPKAGPPPAPQNVNPDN